jgi:hypothetical protein
MTSQAIRRAGIPVAVALVVLAVVLGVAYLADRPGEDSGGPVVGAPGSGGGQPGSTGSALPPDTGAADPDPGQSQQMTRFTSATAGEDGRSLDVRFWGGVKDCYRYTVRVQESADRVSLRLDEQVTFDGPCIELAQEYDRTVRLQEPLGPRTVVDAETGEALLAPSP